MIFCCIYFFAGINNHFSCKHDPILLEPVTTWVTMFCCSNHRAQSCNRYWFLLRPTKPFATSIHDGGATGDGGGDIFAATAIGFCYDQQFFLLHPSTTEVRLATVAVTFLLQPLLVFATTNNFFCYIHARRTCDPRRRR